MASRPVFLSHESSLAHDTGMHPESIRRIEAVDSLLRELDWLGYERVSSPPVALETLAAVHPTAQIEAIAEVARRGGAQLDADTWMSAGSYEAALHACGGAVELTRRLLDGGAGQVGFSAHRPPGHHALPSRAMGFCLFNNIAVAARFALDELRISRVMILDWDVHHGNGTNDIFYESDEVLFISIHESPLYPGSGRASELGSGAGHGYTVNLPVPPGSGDATFVSLVRDVALPLARSYGPELVLVSAGYDAHHADPIASCEVSDNGFATMSALVRDLAGELAVPVGCVLEGGYNVDALARGVAGTMRTLACGFDPARPEADARANNTSDTGTNLIGVHELAQRAIARLTPLWPDITSAT
jgi:acetoin utilization deacetylase AcuC-like enzyme